ncbi:Predicted exporter protein, RND superfamily [Sulfobacillus thermosulfidooxidans DSM 9293]|uniref:Predicted exporter protein, RND superfamily n=1 Tax=Sulfobacillus thermosulfidooxidans (strain DSM 9293 / VKM B-1269 / AT-1) TaxID=929705 RepID=A0A1W1WC72_SULTA|nr:Predicted exporter protein, RND superfamily [Sulfobacillus thermosulfidooxidans DSM 9293]
MIPTIHLWGITLHLTGAHSSILAIDISFILLGLILFIGISQLFGPLRFLRAPLVFVLACLLAVWLWPAARQLGSHTQSSQLLSSQNSLLWADHLSAIAAQGVDAGPLNYDQASSWLVTASKTQLLEQWHNTHGAIPVANLKFYALTDGATLIQIVHPQYALAATQWIVHLPSQDDPTVLNANTANRWLNHAVEHSLSTTEVDALGLAALLLMAILGSLPLTLLSLIGGALATLYASAFMVLFTIHGHLSEFSVNIVELLTLGLSIDYSVFLSLRFRREYFIANKQGLSPSEAKQQADARTRRRVLGAISLSATVLIAVLSGLLFLPHSLSISLVMSAWIAVLVTYLTIRWVTYPLLASWPALISWASWKTSLSDGLDHAYETLQAILQKAPQGILLALMAITIFALAKPYPPFTLTTPVNSLELLPQHSALYQALKLTSPPPRKNVQDAIVIQPTSSFNAVSTWQTIANITTLVSRKAPHDHFSSPTSFASPQVLAKEAHNISPGSSPLAGLINSKQHVILIAINGPSPLPRSSLIDVLKEHLPTPWQFGISGGNHAYTATANTGLVHGIIGVLALGILGTVVAMKYLTKGWLAGLLASAFDLTILLAGLRIAQHWALLSQSILLFPMIIVVVSLLMALSLDYEILLVHDIGSEITRFSIGKALHETGGSITGAGIIIATTFFTLMMTPVPFLQLTGLIIGVSLLVDTLIVRSLLIPTTLMLIYEPWPSFSPEFFQWNNINHLIAKLVVFSTVIVLASLLVASIRHTTIIPHPIPSWSIPRTH